MPLRNVLPKWYTDALFGDREKWGKVPDQNDPSWIEWTERQAEIYRTIQKAGIGKRVNDAGYRVLSTVSLSEKTVLEIGPGELTHINQWVGTPGHYILVDQSQEFLASAKATLVSKHISVETHLVKRHGPALNGILENSVDIVLTFANLEHLHPLDDHLNEICRVLKPGGILVGSIPTEGGLAWGIGRYLTSFRWFKQNTNIDLKRLICWEHPNFADEILALVSRGFDFDRRTYWPSKLPSIDTNLIISFVSRLRKQPHNKETLTDDFHNGPVKPVPL